MAKTEVDSAGRSVAVLRQDSANAAQMRVGFSYDGFSQLRSLIRTKNGVEKAHRTEYDRQGRTVKSIDANLKESTAAYEPFCVGYATTSARGVRTKSSFDTLCRLTQVEVGSPDLSDPLAVLSSRETRAFEYDDLGRLTKTSQATSAASIYGGARFGQSRYGSGAGSAEERSFEYNALDQVEKMTFEDGKTMEFLYDEEGNVIQVTENASGTSKVTQFSYYGDNRLYQVTYVRSGGNQVFTYAYDAGGRPLTLTYPSSTGIVAHFSGPSSEVGWDGNGQLKHLRYVKGGSTLVRRFEFEYDDAGNRISQLDVTPSKATKWAYGYDWLDRLESVKKAEAATVGALGALQLVAMYTYDAADNRYLFEVPNLANPSLTETFRYSYDDADSLTEIEKKVGAGAYSSIETFTSDDDGNLLTRVSGAVTTTYSWDDFNRLKAISTSDNSKKQSHTFGISGFRRKKKDKNDVETTEYAAGLSTEVSKVTSGETITYLKGGGGIMGFERSSDGAMFFFITDALSTVRDVVNSSGTVVASYEFDEYGRRIASSESGASSQKTFVGGLSVQDEVADTGLMMMGHRFYAPDLGRFLNRDPIGFAGGMNLFEYAGGSPQLYTDPRGLELGEGHGVSDYARWAEAGGGGELTSGEKQALAEFVLGFYPPIGFGLSLRDFSRDPSPWNGGLLVVSAFGLRSWSKGLQGASHLRRAGQRGTFGGNLYHNQFPHLLSCELANARSVGVSTARALEPLFDEIINQGTIKWVVTESGDLVIAPHTYKGLEISHAVLDNGRPVLTAGQADIAGFGGSYIGIEITNHSGHYQPSLESVETIGKAAFGAIGVSF